MSLFFWENKMSEHRGFFILFCFEVLGEEIDKVVGKVERIVQVFLLIN